MLLNRKEITEEFQDIDQLEQVKSTYQMKRQIF